MGDPRKPRKKYDGPTHPWQKERIDREKVLLREYGLTNKKELWKMNTMITQATNQSKKLAGATGVQAEKEKKQLLARLVRLGLIAEGAALSDVLELGVEHMCNRRLQTLLFRKGLARTTKQARQFITHRHVKVNGKLVTSPSYIVPVAEEDTITFLEKSALASVDHPERSVEEKPKPAEAEEKPKEKKQEKKEEKKEAPKEEPKKEEKKPEEKPKEEVKEEPKQEEKKE